MIETGDLLLFKNDTLYSKLIKKATDSKYTHVAIALNEYIMIEASLRVQIMPIPDKNPPYDIFRIKNGLNNREKNKLTKELLKHHNALYDILQIIGYAPRLIFQYTPKMLFNYIPRSIFFGQNKLNNPRYMICSELADRAYHEIGYDLLPNIYPGDATPGDFVDSEHLIKL